MTSIGSRSRTACGLIAALTCAAIGASAESVSLTVSPSSSLETTVHVTSAFGNDSDGPVPAAVTGSAQATFTSVVDPSFGRVASELQLTASDLTISDVAFQLFVVIPIDISVEGAQARFGTALLTPGTPIASNTAAFDLAPLDFEYTAGEIVVLDPPGVPLAGTFLDLMGQAQVETTESGGMIQVRITIPVADTTSTTESGITVELVTNGTLVLEGSVNVVPVPTLSAPTTSFLVLGLVWLGATAAVSRSASPVRTASGPGRLPPDEAERVRIRGM